MSKIFGGSKSKSKTVNTNNTAVTNSLSPLMAQATAANQKVSSFLEGNTEEFDRFADSAGFDFELGRGMDNLNSSFAGRSVFKSGARDKSLAEFGQGLKGRFAQQYIQALLGQGQQGLGAAGAIAGVGQMNESSSKSKPGIGSLVGAGLSGAAALGWNPLSKGS